MTPNAPQVILASASPSRRQILSNAGVSFSVEPAPVDEVEIKIALKQEDASAQAVAETLAELKAAPW